MPCFVDTEQYFALTPNFVAKAAAHSSAADELLPISRVGAANRLRACFRQPEVPDLTSWMSSFTVPAVDRQRPTSAVGGSREWAAICGVAGMANLAIATTYDPMAAVAAFRFD